MNAVWQAVVLMFGLAAIMAVAEMSYRKISFLSPHRNLKAGKPSRRAAAR